VPRDSPQSIKSRIRATVLTNLACLVIAVYVLVIPGKATPREVLTVLGIFPIDPIDTAKCMLLVIILFAAPLFETGIVEGNWRHWGRWSVFRNDVIDDWIGWRNLVVGPISEELVFRSLAISLFLLAQSKPTYIILIVPFIFGSAHLHHMNEFIISHKKPDQSYISATLTPSIIVPSLLRGIMQFSYTTPFGAFCCFVFLRTGNVYSCILAHTFCNWIGLPRFWGRLGQVAGERIVKQVQEKRDDDDEQAGSGGVEGVDTASELKDSLTAGQVEQHLGIGWTITYYVLLVAGSFGFYKLLWSLTESKMALARF